MHSLTPYKRCSAREILFVGCWVIACMWQCVCVGRLMCWVIDCDTLPTRSRSWVRQKKKSVGWCAVTDPVRGRCIAVYHSPHEWPYAHALPHTRNDIRRDHKLILVSTHRLNTTKPTTHTPAYVHSLTLYTLTLTHTGNDIRIDHELICLPFTHTGNDVRRDQELNFSKASGCRHRSQSQPFSSAHNVGQVAWISRVTRLDVNSKTAPPHLKPLGGGEAL